MSLKELLDRDGDNGGAQSRLPSCIVCRTAVKHEDSITKPGGIVYHKKCLNCSSCGLSLVGRLYVQKPDGSLLCSACKEGGRKDLICNGCEKAIGGAAYITAMDVQWHQGCFTCSNPNCDEDLSNQAFGRFEGQPYCGKHIPRDDKSKKAAKKATKKKKKTPTAKASSGKTGKQADHVIERELTTKELRAKRLAENPDDPRNEQLKLCLLM